MSTYLGRPVFEFALDWAKPVNTSFAYDLAEVELGHCAPFFDPRQNHVVHGFNAQVKLWNDTEIAAFDAFFEALTGRLAGFWFPAPMTGMTAASSPEKEKQFSIVNQGLADIWDDHPAVHLWITASGQTPVSTKIASVVAAGVMETVNLETGVPWWIDVPPGEIEIYRLHYVRLADDREAGTFTAEGRQERTLRLLELPEEYALAETGVNRIHIYRFWADAPVNMEWNYTNWAAGVVSNGTLYTSFPMEHGGLRRGLELSNEGVDITAKNDANHPFALFFPLPFSRPLNVQILETTVGTPDTVTVLFTGRVIGVRDDGDRLKGQCESLTHMLSRKVPGPLIQPKCPWTLFEPGTCKAKAFHHDATGTLLDVWATPGWLEPGAAVQLDVETTARLSLNYYAGGLISAGAGTSYELRMILSSTDGGQDGLFLTLNAPFQRAAAGARCHLLPGCDGAAATCKDKFWNYKNFGGFPAVPSKNPALTSLNYGVSSGGKK